MGPRGTWPEAESSFSGLTFPHPLGSDCPATLCSPLRDEGCLAKGRTWGASSEGKAVIFMITYLSIHSVFCSLDYSAFCSTHVY